MKSRSPRGRGLGALAVVVVAGLATTGGPRALPQAKAGPARPNVIVILTDDQAWNMTWGMPNLHQKIISKGVEFKNGLVVDPLCCPSRATILTGEYPHTTGVWTNGADDSTGVQGGFWAFRDSDESTVARWLDDDGYRTGYFGKYLNKYGQDEASYTPPGWDRWVAMVNRPDVGDADLIYYTYSLTNDGDLTHYGSRPKDYGTDVVANKVVNFIRSSDRPFFALFSPPAPHAPAIPAPRHEDAYPEFPRYRPPSYDEADVSDKPTWVQELPPLSRYRKRHFDNERHQMFRSLLAVDDAIGRFIRTLRESGELQNTAIVFISDNGYLFGEHRRHFKRDPYEEGIHVPFAIRYDNGIPKPKADHHLVANLDLAETIADITGTPHPDTEGTSFRPLLNRVTAQEELDWRDEVLLELGFDDVVPAYCGARDDRYKYVAYESTNHDGDLYDDEELYDLANDPYELENLASDPSALDADTPDGAETIALLEGFRQYVTANCNPAPPNYDFDGAPLEPLP